MMGGSHVEPSHRARTPWWLWLYPSDFRREFAHDLVLLADELVQDRGMRGRRVLAIDLLVAVPRIRWEYTMRSSPLPGQLIAALTVLAVATWLATVAFGLSSTGTIIAAVVTAILLALALAQRSVLGRAFAAPDQAPKPTTRRVLLQSWWAPLAVVHALATLTFGVALGLGGGDDVLGSVIGFAVAVVFGAGILAGLVVRLSRPGLGAAMIVIGTVPLGGAFWMWWPPVLMLLVWIGVMSSAISRARHQAHTVS
ncbi:MAG: hypothetical protein ABR592_07140 [Nitriliruptorales bacterium]